MLELILAIILIIISFILLIKGADFLVDGAVDFSKFLRVSPLLVGLTIVAFGTSLPELMISLFSAIGGYPGLSVGNIIGSNIFNIALIIGLSAVIAVKGLKSNHFSYDFFFMIVSAFLLLILSFDKDHLILSRIDGIILLLVFMFFLAYIFISMRHDQQKQDLIKQKYHIKFDGSKNKNSLWKNILLIIGGLILLVIGGKLFVSNATKLISILGLTESFIGLTIAAMGTSLPELFTSIIAAKKKQMDIAVGNIVGSNILNILFVLGITSLVHPISIAKEIFTQDMILMILITIIFTFFAFTKKKISRTEGIILLTLFVIYFLFLCWRL